MRQIAILGLIAGMCLGARPAAGQDEATRWRLSLGANRRTFDRVQLNGFDFAAGDDVFVNGTVVDLGPGTLPVDQRTYRYTVVDPVKQVDNTTLDKIEYHDAALADTTEEHPRGAAGAVLRLVRPLAERGAFTLELDISLATAFLRDDVSGAAQTEAFQFDVAPNQWPGGAGPDPNDFSEEWKVHNRTQIASPNTAVTATVKADVDFDLYTIGFGLDAACTRDRWGVAVGVAPTLSIIDYDFARRATVRWADDGGTFFRSESTDDGQRLLGGFALQALVRYRVTDRIGIMLGGRYDHVFQTLDTDVADVDLSGFSCELDLTFRF